MQIDGPAAGKTLVLAHGAGAPMDSEFMNRITRLLNERGIRVVRFEFPYMTQRRLTGTKRPPDRAPKLVACYGEVLDKLNAESPVFIGGKSMGGRMATMLAAERTVAGVCVLGYPFHAPGKPERIRTEHFRQLKCPVLICQGERDPMGRREEVEDYAIPSGIHLHWLPDGDHDLKPRKASGHSHAQNLTASADAVAAFMDV